LNRRKPGTPRSLLASFRFVLVNSLAAAGGIFCKPATGQPEDKISFLLMMLLVVLKSLSDFSLFLWDLFRSRCWQSLAENVFPAAHEARCFSDKLLSGVLPGLLFRLTKAGKRVRPNSISGASPVRQAGARRFPNPCLVAMKASATKSILPGDLAFRPAPFSSRVFRE